MSATSWARLSERKSYEKPPYFFSGSRSFLSIKIGKKSAHIFFRRGRLYMIRLIGLLISWATPATKVPNVSIFWACCNCCWRSRSAVSACRCRASAFSSKGRMTANSLTSFSFVFVLSFIGSLAGEMAGAYRTLSDKGLPETGGSGFPLQSRPASPSVRLPHRRSTYS